MVEIEFEYDIEDHKKIPAILQHRVSKKLKKRYEEGKIRRKGKANKTWPETIESDGIRYQVHCRLLRSKEGVREEDCLIVTGMRQLRGKKTKKTTSEWPR